MVQGSAADGSEGRATGVEDSLVRRWAEIDAALDRQENSENDELAEEEEAKLLSLKAKWFHEAFKFLESLPSSQHCWCGHKTVTLPLLEPFYHFDTGQPGSQQKLRRLWARLSNELSTCVRCVSRHHAAQAYYRAEFVEEVVEPVLRALQRLDEERVAAALQGLLERERSGSLSTKTDGPKAVCCMYEVLTFPRLLDDSEVFHKFGEALRVLSEHFDLSLSKGQRYPGVHVLMLHPDKAVRAIVYGLAKPLGSFSKPEELEALQPFLTKCINALEFDLFDEGDGGQETNPGDPRRRKRTAFKRESLWQGLQTMLSFMEPIVLEEAFVDRHPSIVSIVLNHVATADPSTFRCALNCLRTLLVSVPGYKLWLHSALPPSALSSNIISQCFGTTKEPTHKLLVDLFPPFLQSLECLEADEFLSQRRTILHFLLLQVPHSGNFSTTTCSIARRIAFGIVLRGYCTDPPQAPMDCADVWAPIAAIVAKDATLAQPLRDPALVLVAAILSADAAALVSTVSGQEDIYSTPADACAPTESGKNGAFKDKEKEKGKEDREGGAKDTSPKDGGGSKASASLGQGPWFEFGPLCRVAAIESVGWTCCTQVWADILERSAPSQLPPPLLSRILWVGGQLSLVSADLDREEARQGEAGGTPTKAVPRAPSLGRGERCSLGLAVLLRRKCFSFMAQLRQSLNARALVPTPELSEAMLLLLLDTKPWTKDFGGELLRRVCGKEQLDMQLLVLCTTADSASAVSSAVRRATIALTAPAALEGPASSGLQSLFFYLGKLLGPCPLEGDPSKAVGESLSLSQGEREGADKGGGFIRDAQVSTKIKQYFGRKREADEERVRGLGGRALSKGEARAMWALQQAQVGLEFWPALQKLWGRLNRNASPDPAELRLVHAKVLNLMSLVLETPLGPSAQDPHDPHGQAVAAARARLQLLLCSRGEDEEEEEYEDDEDDMSFLALPPWLGSLLAFGRSCILARRPGTTVVTARWVDAVCRGFRLVHHVLAPPEGLGALLLQGARALGCVSWACQYAEAACSQLLQLLTVQFVGIDPFSLDEREVMQDAVKAVRGAVPKARESLAASAKQAELEGQEGAPLQGHLGEGALPGHQWPSGEGSRATGEGKEGAGGGKQGEVVVLDDEEEEGGKGEEEEEEEEEEEVSDEEEDDIVEVSPSTKGGRGQARDTGAGKGGEGMGHTGHRTEDLDDVPLTQRPPKSSTSAAPSHGQDRGREESGPARTETAFTGSVAQPGAASGAPQRGPGISPWLAQARESLQPSSLDSWVTKGRSTAAIQKAARDAFATLHGGATPAASGAPGSRKFGSVPVNEAQRAPPRKGKRSAKGGKLSELRSQVQDKIASEGGRSQSGKDHRPMPSVTPAAAAAAAAAARAGAGAPAASAPARASAGAGAGLQGPSKPPVGAGVAAGKAEKPKISLGELVSDDGGLDSLLAKAEARGTKFSAAGKLKLPELDPQVRRQVIALDADGSVLKPRVVNQQDGAQAQFKGPIPPPKLDVWFRRILAMDYFRVVEGRDGEDPFGAGGSQGGPRAGGLGMRRRGGGGEGDEESLLRVPNVFQSEWDYVRVFRPLVLEEFKAQLKRSHEERPPSLGPMLGSERAPSAFAQGIGGAPGGYQQRGQGGGRDGGFDDGSAYLGKLRLLSLSRVDDFLVVQFVSEAGAMGGGPSQGMCFANDLLLLARRISGKEGAGDGQEEERKESVFVLAKVEHREFERTTQATMVRVKLHIPGGQPSRRLGLVRRLLVDRSLWHATRLLSLTPNLREFQALTSVRYFPLLSTLLDPRSAPAAQHQPPGAPGGSAAPASSPKPPAAAAAAAGLHGAFQRTDSSRGLDGGPLQGEALEASLPPEVCHQLRAAYNDSQLAAIAAAVGPTGVAGQPHRLTLIQGPPGTGKTRTIVAIVSALLCMGSPRGRGEENAAATTPSNPRWGAPAAGRATGAGPRGVTSADITRAWQAAAMASYMEDSRPGSVSGAAAAKRGGALSGQGRGRGERDAGQGAAGGVPGAGKAQAPARARVLICAQSNAAVDEIISRLGKGAGFSSSSTGTPGGDGGTAGSSPREFSVVRVGNPKTIHPDSMPYHIDELVAKKLGARAGNRAGGETNNWGGGEAQRGAAEDGRGGSRDVGARDGRGVDGKASLSELRAKLDRTFEVIRAIEALQWKSSVGGKVQGAEGQGPEGQGDQAMDIDEPSGASKDGAGSKGEGKGGTGGGGNTGNASSSKPSNKGVKEGKGGGGGEGEGEDGEKEQSAEEVAAAVVAQGEAAVRARLNMLHREKRELSRALADAKRGQREAAEEERAARAAAKRDILRGAELVVTTLNGCGGDVYAACLGLHEGPGMEGPGAQGGAEFGAGFGRKARRGGGGPKEDDEAGLFDAVIIDEAAQALEPATLIPLQLLRRSSARCIMVGDPKQLPATVLSLEASRLNYERSLFQRLQDGGYPVLMLSTQYRMHPGISRFPSSFFYDSKLLDAPSISESARTAPFHARFPFRPYAFFDVLDGIESRRGGRGGGGGGGGGGGPSLCNYAEADAALELFASLKRQFPQEYQPGRIALVTPYRQQLNVLKDTFSRALGQAVCRDIEFSTVDGFQGREVDILILSTVRASPVAQAEEGEVGMDVDGGGQGKGGGWKQGGRGGRGRGVSVGFVADERRMNVALTRARLSLWVLGNSSTLSHSTPWAALLQDAAARDAVIPIRRPYSAALRHSAGIPSPLPVPPRPATGTPSSFGAPSRHASGAPSRLETARAPSLGLAPSGATIPAPAAAPSTLPPQDDAGMSGDAGVPGAAGAGSSGTSAGGGTVAGADGFVEDGGSEAMEVDGDSGQVPGEGADGEGAQGAHGRGMEGEGAKGEGVSGECVNEHGRGEGVKRDAMDVDADQDEGQPNEGRGSGATEGAGEGCAEVPVTGAPDGILDGVHSHLPCAAEREDEADRRGQKRDASSRPGAEGAVPCGTGLGPSGAEDDALPVAPKRQRTSLGGRAKTGEGGVSKGGDEGVGAGAAPGIGRNGSVRRAREGVMGQQEARNPEGGIKGQEGGRGREKEGGRVPLERLPSDKTKSDLDRRASAAASPRDSMPRAREESGGTVQGRGGGSRERAGDAAQVAPSMRTGDGGSDRRRGSEPTRDTLTKPQGPHGARKEPGVDRRSEGGERHRQKQPHTQPKPHSASHTAKGHAQQRTHAARPEGPRSGSSVQGHAPAPREKERGANGARAQAPQEKERGANGAHAPVHGSTSGGRASAHHTKERGEAPGKAASSSEAQRRQGSGAPDLDLDWGPPARAPTPSPRNTSAAPSPSGPRPKPRAPPGDSRYPPGTPGSAREGNSSRGERPGPTSARPGGAAAAGVGAGARPVGGGREGSGARAGPGAGPADRSSSLAKGSHPSGQASRAPHKEAGFRPPASTGHRAGVPGNTGHTGSRPPGSAGSTGGRPGAAAATAGMGGGRVGAQQKRSVPRPSTLLRPKSKSVVDDILEAVVGVSKSQAIARKAEEAVSAKAEKLSNR